MLTARLERLADLATGLPLRSNYALVTKRETHAVAIHFGRALDRGNMLGAHFAVDVVNTVGKELRNMRFAARAESAQIDSCRMSRVGLRFTQKSVSRSPDLLIAATTSR